MSKQAPNAVYLLTCQDVGFYGSPGALRCSGPGAGAFSYGSKCHVGEAVMAPQPTIQFSRQRVGNASYSSSDLILEREPARAGWGGAMWPQPVLECGVGGSLRHSQGKGTDSLEGEQEQGGVFRIQALVFMYIGLFFRDNSWFSPEYLDSDKILIIKLNIAHGG